MVKQIYFCRAKAAASKPMPLPVKIFIGCMITVAAVGAIVGPSVYFGLAGKRKRFFLCMFDRYPLLR